MSIIEEGPERKVRMANLAIVGTHSTNGVAAIHSRLLRTQTVKDLAEMFPERFNNKTNGVTPRRWLLLANPALSRTDHESHRQGWITDLSQLEETQSFATDAVPGRFTKAKRSQKAVRRLAQIDERPTVDPDSIFDCQVKRIHEYKRQLLNALRIVILYNRLRENPSRDAARTFFFAGKAAPPTPGQAHHQVHQQPGGHYRWRPGDARPAQGHLPARVLRFPGERLIPASDVSDQISTAGYEASGTSNMKFMMNGALTLGTRDGATIEMAEEAGEENFFLFGLTAEQVAKPRLVQSVVALRKRAGDTGRAGPDLLRSLQPQ